MRFVQRQPDDSVNLPKSHPLRNAAELVLGVGALVLVASLLVTYFVDIAVAVIPYEAEAEFSSRLFRDSTMGLGAPGDQSSALEQLTARLSSGWPDNPYSFRVRIADMPKPNAFALPGGLIVVTQGLLDACESENELAFVLAHEIAHYRNRDQLRGMGSALLLQMALSMVGAAGDISPLSSPMQLAQLGSSREREEAADRFGLSLVAAHYGHINGSWAFFEHLTDEGDATPAFFSTHPGSAGRAQALRRIAAQNGWSTTGTLRPWPMEQRAAGDGVVD
ncbi:MAG: M48 family metallopeptidase [Myxococcales bacterium]|nr:M48 family metallopeptidase [Myxococcales bacterium]MDD9966734.1 M48 family metallopeptidase [Myxococcales bacterium]